MNISLEKVTSHKTEHNTTWQLTKISELVFINQRNLCAYGKKKKKTGKDISYKRTMENRVLKRYEEEQRKKKVGKKLKIKVENKLDGIVRKDSQKKA
ncbi:DgyrCDS4067 [Dimorphilus gyrociliatus]|uniref:DgyrCDS4067 n=1 Tax=Dimorphilus gyrociliatus TaxID=2664684 RepID=A0A7I8VFU1_9ANNE|nr:DgyrCDS4067 [Dimorphilus gyrociliatus]